MGLYSRYILPKAIHCACSLEPSMRQREKVVPQASGCVLEVGIGSGLNFPFYNATQVSKVWGLDPAPEMTKMAKRAAGALSFEVEFISLPIDQLPLEDNSIDTVVVTYTLCTIPDTTGALRQISRVLRPGGELIFCEHGAAPDAGVRLWQDRLNPLWSRLGGGCNLNREIPAVIEAGGFQIKQLQASYLAGWRPVSYNYWGNAVPR